MSDITCDCSVDIDEPAEVWEEKIVKARKEHVCCECHGTIKVGEKYQRVKALWDGHWNEYKTCITCNNIRQRYCSSGYYFEGLAEQLWECLGFDYREVPEDED